MPKLFLAILILFIGATRKSLGWGFYAHKRINRLAVFTLPPEMLPFFKYHISYITEQAVHPDSRRYSVEGEAPRHYIDADKFGDSAVYKLPRFWKKALEQYPEDTLMKHGINPWFIHTISYQLTNAFKQRDANKILRLAADMGHYIADGHVPLHTTSNYNGQFTNQVGIHAFWETRLPELFSENYDFYIGSATYESNLQQRAWKAIIASHRALDSVLLFEKMLTTQFQEDKKYSYEERNNLTVRVYSKAFASAYHEALSGQVERRMRASIQMIGDFWYTCWVNAGQPDLITLIPLGGGKPVIILDAGDSTKPLLKPFDVRPESVEPKKLLLGAHTCACCEFHHEINGIGLWPFNLFYSSR